MAKKENMVFTAKLTLNENKGGGWLAHAIITKSDDSVAYQEFSAWKNASAAKKWCKEKVQENTPRKSVKFVAGDKLDAKGKPVSFLGVLAYKD